MASAKSSGSRRSSEVLLDRMDRSAALAALEELLELRRALHRVSVQVGELQQLLERARGGRR